ncbi:hypothetical protein [Aquicoccus sp. SU-CL01552]|uniref:hypothetical protein n=1 Tax=Aquicoccus sp. SU-CL01552 TaxID=3127656 RepID=UPI003109BA68
MSDQPMTTHAVERIAQRGIQPQALNVVIAYGHDAPTRDGCLKRELRYTRVSEVLADGVPLKIIEAALKIEAILSREERLVTCYMRSPRCLNRPSRRTRIQKRYGRRA